MDGPKRRSGHGDEQDLLARIARADRSAFEALYDWYSHPVYSLALHMLRDAGVAQEVAQEVFLSIWRNAGDFDPHRGTGRSWILALAHHKTVDAVRRQRLRASESLDEESGSGMDIAGEAIRRLDGARVRTALMAISPEQREAIALAYYGGYTQQEIARRLHIPLGTVKTRIRDGMLKLRTMLASGTEDGAL